MDDCGSIPKQAMLGRQRKTERCDFGIWSSFHCVDSGRTRNFKPDSMLQVADVTDLLSQEVLVGIEILYVDNIDAKSRKTELA